MTRHIMAFVLLLTTPLLAGCAATNLSSLLPSSPFSSKGKTAAASPQVAPPPAAVPERTGTTNTASRNTVPPAAVNMGGCPKFKVWDAGRHLTLYVPGQTGDPKAIYHQASIQKTARECFHMTGSLTAKLGIAGRVLLGPKGRPAKIRLPLRVHLFDNQSKKVKSKKYNLFVNLSGGKTAGQFSVVERFTFRPRPGTSPATYRIYVEFDKSIPGAG